MNYKDKVIELVRKKTLSTEEIKKLEEIFPELRESEDERIRKWLICTLKSLNNSPVQIDGAYEMMLPAIDWLENQGKQNLIMAKSPQLGEQKHAEWNREDEQNLNACLGYIPDEYLRRWLTDAIHAKYDKPTDKVELKFKVGDVLCDYCEEFDNPLIFILKKFEHVDFGLVKPSDYSSYCFLTAGDRQIFKEGEYHHEHNIKPATKEQRDLLFNKMHEAGYEWDAEKKELKKIEQKQDFNIQIDPSEYINDMGGNGCYLKNTTQTFAWSEEDEIMKNQLVNFILSGIDISKAPHGCVAWLKSIKERYT